MGDTSDAAILPRKELQVLLQIFQDESNTLEDTLASINAAFTKTEHFRVACALCLLIEDNLLTTHQRLVAFYVVYSLFRDEESGLSPFIFSICDSLEKRRAPLEQQFLLELLKPNGENQYKSKSSAEIVAVLQNKISTSQIEVDHNQLRELRNKLASIIPAVRRLQLAEVRPVVLDPVGPTALSRLTASLDDGTPEGRRRALCAPSGSHQVLCSLPDTPMSVDSLPRSRPNVKHAFQSALGLAGEERQDGHQAGHSSSQSQKSSSENHRIADEFADELSQLSIDHDKTGTAQAHLPQNGDGIDGLDLHGFQPMFARPVPPLLAMDESEYAWLVPTEPAPLLWDMKAPPAEPAQVSQRGELIRDILQRGCEEALPPATIEKLTQLLDADPEAENACTLRLEKLPDLVEKNPLVAIACLQQILRTSKADEFLLKLVNMEVSVQSMEVVNKLTAEAQVPKEFLHMYISNCISRCENMDDKYLQARLVRLVCVFLQSLLRNKIIDASDLIVEAQTFCVTFARVKEAQTLYKRLKNSS